MIRAEVMKAVSGSEADLSRPDYSAERKWDGTRVFIQKNGQKVRLVVARGKKSDHTNRFPLIVRATKKLKCHSCVLDGEFVWYDKRGQDVFMTIAAKEASKSLKHKVIVFDVLEWNGKDVRREPLEVRRSILASIIPKNLTIINQSEVMYRQLRMRYRDLVHNKGAEGFMLKKARSQYRSGKRSHDWIKVKKGATIDCLVLGATYSKEGSRKDLFRALKCYSKRRDGTLAYVGDVGSGLSYEDLRVITPLVKRKEPKPFVIEVSYMEFGSHKHMRHPVFKRLRLDKHIDDIDVEPWRNS